MAEVAPHQHPNACCQAKMRGAAGDEAQQLAMAVTPAVKASKSAQGIPPGSAHGRACPPYPRQRQQQQLLQGPGTRQHWGDVEAQGLGQAGDCEEAPCVEGACSVQTAQLLHQIGDAFHCGATWHGSHNCLGAVPPAAGSHAGHMIGAYSGKGHCRVQWEGR